MATSSNTKIQALMDEVDELDGNDANLEAKLAEIARKVKEEQRKMRTAVIGHKDDDIKLDDDPADAFACEGCQ